MNFIVIVADSLRVDHVGTYGSQIQTPNLDKLASESAVFEQAYAENLPTFPCRTAWWTGQYLFPVRGWQPLELSDVLLAEVLWSRGYTSALVTDTYHMHKPSYNAARGFDSTFFIRGQEYDPWVVDEMEVDLKKHHRMRGDERDEHWRNCFVQYLKNRTRFTTEADHCTPRVFSTAMHWLEGISRQQDDDLFLWVDSFSPHEPWDPPEPYRSMYDPDYQGHEIIDPVPGASANYMTDDEVKHTKALYGGCVTLVDKWVGLLLDKVRELGLWDNTMIMFTSDHGEPFGEHGIIRKAGAWNHEFLAHIPWIIRHPDGLGAGKRFSAFVQPPDLMPTALDALGETTDQSFQGTSLMPLLKGETDSVRDFAVTGWYQRQWSIRTDDWTYIMNLSVDGPPGLYNRKTDFTEQTNVIDQHPDVGTELELRLRRFAAEMSGGY